MSAQKKLSKRKQVIFTAMLFSVSVIIGLLLAEIGLRLYQRQLQQSDQMKQGLVRYDSELGWSLTPGWRGKHTNKDFSVSYQINNLGLRSPWLTVSAEKPTTLVLGDSFTFGIGVDNGNTFVDILNSLLPDQQFINAGVPGYSTDQEYLALQQWAPVFKPENIMLVVYLGNDILDNIREYPLQASHAKPWFSLKNGRLVPSAKPVSIDPKPIASTASSVTDIAFGAQTKRWYQYSKLGALIPTKVPYTPAIAASLARQNESALTLFRALLEQILKSAENTNSQLSLVLLPDGHYFREPLSYSHHYQTFFLQYIKDLADELGIVVFDGSTLLANATDPAKMYHPHEGHLSAYGHKALADGIAENGRRFFLHPPQNNRRQKSITH